MRRKLRTFKRWLAAGKMKIEDIRISYTSWKGHMKQCNAYRTVLSMDALFGKLRIKHQLIRAYTPRHNGKVERSHRTDGENFYKTLTFETYDELKEKMAEWNIRYNNRPHSSLRNREGKRVWFTPLQKRAELMAILKAGQTDTPRVRFIKQKAA